MMIYHRGIPFLIRCFVLLYFLIEPFLLYTPFSSDGFLPKKTHFDPERGHRHALAAGKVGKRHESCH